MAGGCGIGEAIRAMGGRARREPRGSVFGDRENLPVDQTLGQRLLELAHARVRRPCVGEIEPYRGKGLRPLPLGVIVCIANDRVIPAGA